MRMIDAAKLTVPGLPGGTELSGNSLPQKVDIDLQPSEIKEESFDASLLSHLSELSEREALGLSDILLWEQKVLPDGKELPLLPGGNELLLLPLADQVADTELDLLVDPGLSLQAESDAIMAGQPLVLPLQMEQGRPGEKIPGTSVTQVQNQAQSSTPTVHSARSDLLLFAADDTALARTDITSGNVNLIKPDAQMSERSTEMSAIVSPGINAKVMPAESTNQIMGAVRLSIDAPVQQAKWGDNLAGRVAWMLMNNQHSARISLNPPELGPIEIKINLHNDQASVNFYAHNSAVRDAIEEAFPRLRDMLNENGFNLSQSSVSDQSLSQRQGYSETARQEQSRYPFMEEGDPVETRVNEVINLKLGLVDHFV